MNHIKYWKERLLSKLNRKPQTRAELIDTLRTAEQEHILDSESEGMLEGVLQVSEMQIRDIMVPRSQMITIAENQNLPNIISTIVESLHSRYPVMGTQRDHVIGILLAKDLLQFTLPDNQQHFNLRKMLQPTMIVPETQHLDKLLKEFKNRRSHMAIVVDEYGNIAGLVTMEDVLEQIVGDIEDESDYDEDIGIKKYDDYYIVKADVSIEEFDEYFHSNLDDDGCETISGFILNHLGHIPTRNEEFNFGNFHFKVLHADKRRIRLLQVTQNTITENNEA